MKALTDTSEWERPAQPHPTPAPTRAGEHMRIYLSNRCLSASLPGTSAGQPSRQQRQERDREAVLVGREDPVLQIPLLGGSVMGRLFLPSRL